MYKESLFPASILIVKTSSLGDIIQAFNVLDDLHRRFPSTSIDWVVEPSFYSIVSAHPLVRRAIPFDLKKRGSFWEGVRNLRGVKYDLVFDIQGNCKSGLITFFARSKVKVGYGLKSVREWPNVLATNIRYPISKQKNIRLYYLDLIAAYFNEAASSDIQGVRFKIGDKERERVAQILARASAKKKIMVCPGSRWENKQVSLKTFASFLQKIEKKTGASFFLVWGADSEKSFCEELASHLEQGIVIDKLPLPTWQNLMSEVDLVIAVDSSALHLCGTTATPSFSIFGPTSPHVFKPLGKNHVALQGPCPYGRVFEKQCPVLRTCPTGGCIKNLTAEELFEAFQNQCGFLQCGSPR